MANDFLSKYVKPGSRKSRQVTTKSNSWVSNALKSVGYSAFDVLTELMPATVDSVKTTATIGKDIAESVKKARTSDRSLKTAMNRNYYVGLGKDILKNSLEDLKSGKFYNKDRQDAHFASMNDDLDDLDFNFDDEDFDVDEFDDSIDSADGMAHASFNRKKGGNNEVTNIVVGTNLGPDSAIVKATEFQTETSVNVGRAVIDNSRVNNRAMMTMVGGLRNEVTTSLSAISDNISTMTGVVSESLGKHMTLSAKYFEDSISIQTQILEHLKSQATGTTTNTKQFKEYNNILDIITSGGALDFNAYKSLIKKQAGNYVDNNMLLSQLKFMNDNRDSLQMVALNPFQKVLENTVKSIIPKTMQTAMTAFDNQLKETTIAALNQVSGLQRSNNPILSAIGQIFGVQNKLTISKVDKSAYNKGAMSWSGTDHQALTNVIPTLLRKIYASVSGAQEIGFDYNQGVFRNVKDMEDEAEKEKLRRETGGYAEYKSGFKEFLDKNFAASREQKEGYSNNFEKFISKLVRDSHGGRTFRRGGRNGKQKNANGDELDDIRDLIGAGSSDDKNVQIIRAYFNYLERTDKAALTRFFGNDLQQQRASLDRQNREIQNDPIKYNTLYMDTGLTGAHKTDSHLSFDDKNNKSRVTGVKSGVATGPIDKYGRNSNYYLREILNTLTTGIYVVPIGSLDGSGSSDNSDILSAITGRRTDSINKLREDKNKAKRNEDSNRLKPSTYDDERRRKDVESGKFDVNEDIDTDVVAMSAASQETSEANTEDKTFIGKIMSKIPEDSGLGRILGHIRKSSNKMGEKGTGIFNTLNKALFDVVFGDGEGRKGASAIFNKAMGVLKSGFKSFSSFLDNKIFKPLDNALFGEDGFVNKIKQSDFGQKMSEMFKNVKSKVSSFFLGDLDGEGKRSGGLFSETFNSLKDIGTHVKNGILGEKGPDGKPLPLDQDNSVLGNLKRVLKSASDSIGSALGIEKSNETFGTKLNNTVDSVFHRISDRASEWSDNIFGRKDKDGNELNTVFNSEFASQFKEDLKGQKGYIGATSVIGLLGSFFLPGGPIGGALVGAGVGIISKSTSLKNLLFGPEDGDNGRTGGLITKEVQDFFKKNKTGITVGAIGGLASSIGLLPSFFLPGGPIGGALIGTGISMIAKSDAFNTLLYGEGGTKDDPTGGLMANFKKAFGKNKDLKNVGLDAGIGAGVGLLGSFFLPGGPLIHALLGSVISVGTATDKFKNWFFGKPDDDGKRSGGIFGKFSDFMKEKIFTPLSTGVKLAQSHIMGFVEENMVLPFKYALKPLMEEAKHAKDAIGEKISGVFDSLKASLNKRIVKPIGDTLDKYLITPIKNTLNKLFSGLGKIVGGIISAPFKLFGAMGWGAYEKQKKRGREEYINKAGREDKSLFGRIKGGFKRAGMRLGLIDREGVEAAQYSEAGASYEAGQEVERRQRYENERADIRARREAERDAIRNGTFTKASPNTSSTGEETRVATSTDNTETTGGSNKKSKKKYDSNKKKKRGAARRNRRNKKGSQNPTPNTSNSNINTDIDVDSDNSDENTRVSLESNDSSNIDLNTSSTDNKSDYKPEPPKVNTSVDTGSTKVKTDSYTPSSEKSSSKHTKDSGKAIQVIQRDVSKISDSVYGQLNGVGSNVNKIYRLLLKKFGKEDSDIEGDNNKEYVGLFGRIRTALNDPLNAIKDIITAPFRKIADIGHNIANSIKNVGSNIKKAGKFVISGLGGIIKGLGKAGLDLVHTGLSAVRAALPAIGEAVKVGVSVIGDGLKAAGSILVTGVQTIGNTIAGAASGFGQLLGGAMSGLGNILGAFGLIGKDVLSGIWGGLKFIGGKALDIGKSILSAPGNIIGSIADRIGGKGDKKGGLFGKGPTHVIVDGGILDKVKLVKVVELVKKIGYGGSLEPDDPFTGGGDGGDKKGKPSPKEAVRDIADDDKKGGDKKGKPSPKEAVHVIADDDKDDKKGGDKKGKPSSSGPTHVIVDGGILDKINLVKVVELVKKIGHVDGPDPGDSSGPKIVPSGSSDSDTTNKTKTRVSGNANILPMNLQFFAKKLEPGDTAVNSENNDGNESNAANDKLKSTGNTIREKLKSKDDAEREQSIERGSRESLLGKFKTKDSEEEQESFRSKLLSFMQRNADASEEHKASFMKVFDLKKGIITAGIIALAPFIIKLFKKFDIGGLLTSLASSIATGFSEVGGIKGVLNNILELITKTKDTANGEDTHYSVDEDGNLVYDEDGNLVKETTDSSRISTLLTPTKTRIDTKTGKWENRKTWTGMSDSLVNFASQRALTVGKAGVKAYRVGKKVAKGVKAVGKGAYRVGKNVATKTFNYAKDKGSKFVTKVANGESIVNKVYDSGKGLATKAFNYAKDKGSKFATKIANNEGMVGKAYNTGKKVATKTFEAVKSKGKNIITKVSSDDGIISKAITMMKQALELLVTKFQALGKRFGVKIGEGTLGTVLKSVSKIFDPTKLKGFTERIGKFIMKITQKSSVSAGTLFLAEIGFALYGSIDGACNAGALFEVKPKYVDGKMRSIAAIFKGLLNTSIGSWVDLINSLVYEILGFNFIKTISSYVYKLIADNEDDANLDKAQKQFTEDYEKTVEQEYNAYVESTEAQGQTPMSLEDFKASGLSTTRSEYNSKVNKSFAKRIVDGVQGVGRGIKNVGKTVVGGAKKAGTFVVGGAKKIGKSIVGGAKKIGSTVVGGAKKIGKSIAGGAKKVASKVKNSKIVQGAKEKITGLFSKGKEVFGNVGSAISKIATQGADAAKGLLSGFSNIKSTFEDKNNSFIDYFKADVNPVKEDNAFHGLVGGVLNVSKFVMFPKLVIFGILKKVGNAIVDTVKNVFTGVKTASKDYSTNTANISKLAFKGDVEGLRSYEITTSDDNPVGGFVSSMVGISRILHYPIAYISLAGHNVVNTVKRAFTGAKNAVKDYNSNVSNLNELAFSGDVEGLRSYEITTSDDNPVGGFVSSMVGISRILHYPIAYVALAGHNVVNTVKGAFTGAKNAVADYNENTANLNELAFSGDVEGLRSYEITTSDDNPVGGFVSSMVGISRILHYPIAYVALAGHNVVNTVKGAINTVAETGSTIISGVKDIGSLAISGDVNGLREYAGVDEEGNPVGGFANVVLGASKIALAPIAMVTSVGKKAVEFTKSSINRVTDLGGKVKTFITKLNTYTDPKKSLSGWDKETMGNDKNPVNSIISTIIKKVMWVYVGIIRNVKKAFSWIGEKVSSIKDKVVDIADDVGTEVMNLGRGGNDGGRPIGGKGGSDELNGMPYYSQNDPRYKNKPYKETGGRGSSDDTMGERGCGPTAMAMVASKLTGKKYDPMTMAKMAENGGYSTSAGTTPGYFRAAASTLGIANRRDVPNANNLIGSLANGNSVILQGVRGGHSNSPYTSEGHYVAATGIDGKHVIINDPRGREYSGKYRISDVMNDTVGMWSFGGGPGGFGSSKKALYNKKKGIVGGFGTKSDTEKWINIVREVKKAIAAQQPGYSANSIDVTVGGKTISVRTDCSGYVAGCLKFFGVINESDNLTAGTVANPNSDLMRKTGFTSGGWPGWDALQEGDILASEDHTEIFAYNDGDSHFVYNCGSTNSVNSAVPTYSAHPEGYQTVWRCGPAGTGVVTGSASINGSTKATGTGSSSFSGGVSSFSELLSGAADVFSNSIMKGLGFNVDDSSSTGVSTGSSTSNDSIKSANLTGSNNAQKIWNYLKGKGLTDAGAAGLMGNMQQESGLEPTNLQNSYEDSLGFTDQSYTSAVDDGSYNNFVHDSAGYGLVQWTYYSLKQELLDYKKKTGKSIGDLGMQLDFLSHQLESGYPGVWNTLKSTNSIADATDKVMLEFERPEDQSQSARSNRAGLSKSFYDSYAGGNGGNDGGRPIKTSEQMLGGYGKPTRNKVSTTSSSIQDTSSANVVNIVQRNNTAKSLTSDETSQLLKVMIDYLSQIVDNTGATSSELETLNGKDFGIINTTNNTVNNTNNSYQSKSKKADKSADRSGYDMAKRVAAGILV